MLALGTSRRTVNMGHDKCGTDAAICAATWHIAVRGIDHERIIEGKGMGGGRKASRSQMNWETKAEAAQVQWAVGILQRVLNEARASGHSQRASSL